MAKALKRDKNPDTPAATSKYYLTNGKMLPEVVKSRTDGRINNELAKMLMMLTRKYAQRPCFSGYSYKEDMISDALANLCQNALKFNPDKGSNPFSFYTTCINNSFLQFLGVEKKHRRIRDQLLIDMGENPSFNFQEESKGGQDGEFHNEINEIKTNIEEAKVRMEQDAIYAEKKAAAIAAALLEIEQQQQVQESCMDGSCEMLDADGFSEGDPDAIDHLVPNLNLLDFGESNVKEE